MNITDKIKAARKVFVWVDTHEDGSGIFVKVDKKDLMRAVKQNWDNINPDKFRITKDHAICCRILFIHT
jgi:hypothetical protein